MMAAQHYVKGIIQILVIALAGQYFLTQMFFVESIEFDDETLTLGKITRDMQVWQLIELFPQMGWLMVTYYFIVDVENHYIN